MPGILCPDVELQLPGHKFVIGLCPHNSHEILHFMSFKFVLNWFLNHEIFCSKMQFKKIDNRKIICYILCLCLGQ